MVSHAVFSTLCFYVLVFFCAGLAAAYQSVCIDRPPVLVPFIVMLIQQGFGARYIYHLQDIHPEATNVVLPVRPIVFRFLDG